MSSVLFFFYLPDWSQLSLSFSTCLILSIFPPSLTVIPCSRISQLSLYSIALHLPAYLIAPPIHPATSLHLFLHLFKPHLYVFQYFFLNLPSSTIFHHVKSLPRSVLLHLSQPTPSNSIVTSLHPPLSIISLHLLIPCIFFSPFSFSLSLCSLQLVLFGKGSGVRWCHVWRTKAVTC